MDDYYLRQSNQACLAYHQAVERNAPVIEQANFLAQWYRLYWQAARDRASLTPVSELSNRFIVADTVSTATR